MNTQPFIIFLAIVFMCNSSVYQRPESSVDFIHEAEELKSSEGQKLLTSRCLVCHSPMTSSGNRLAPPMLAVKSHYINEHTSLGEFTADLTEFVLSPEAEQTKMPHAVNNFGLMPAMVLTDKQLESIARYIYHTNFERPQRFRNQNNNINAFKSGLFSYLQLGQEYADMAQTILAKNLTHAIQEIGTTGALIFCHENAIDLTKSSTADKNIKIKRVSDKNRNPQNAANNEELEYIYYIQKQTEPNKIIEPWTIEKRHTVVGYYPITTKPVCLQCHGIPQVDIKPDALNSIIELYPEDKAIGYGLNELRGIWVVEMPKKRRNQ